MRRTRLMGLAGLFALAAALLAPRPAAVPPTSAVTLEPIRYAELGDRVVQLQGRVVVVDFWADYCLPCKKAFPRVVELHRTYASQGLTVLAVSLDDPADADARQRVQRFLGQQRARFANFVLNEKTSIWQAKLKIDGPPCVFVFDRRGRLVKKYQDQVNHDELERIVVDLLK